MARAAVIKHIDKTVVNGEDLSVEHRSSRDALVPRVSNVVDAVENGEEGVFGSPWSKGWPTSVNWEPLVFDLVGD